MKAMTFLLDDAEATERAGAAIAHAVAARPGLVTYLIGDLGAGKTTLVRGWLRALGVTGAIRSPTYTLIEPYRVDAREILHMDLYRLLDPSELDGLGLDDYAPRQCHWLVEWPDRGQGRLPPPGLTLTLQAVENKRLLTISEPSAGDETLAAMLAETFRRAD